MGDAVLVGPLVERIASIDWACQYDQQGARQKGQELSFHDSCYSIRYCRIPPLKSFASMPVSGRARQLRGARRLTTRTDVPEFSLSGDRDPSAQHPRAEVARFRGVITVTSGLSDRCHRHRVSPPFLRPASSLTTVARTPRS